ncbi:MAG: hypothetical protein AAFX01_00785 [Cyanobacteria bacterium J06638_28]
MGLIFFRKSLRRISLFISALFITLLSHLSFFQLPANAQLTTDIVVLNTFLPENSPPGEDSVYRLTFRNNTGADVNITGLNHTLPSPSAMPVGSPGNVVFSQTTPTLNTCDVGGNSTFTVTNVGSNPGSPGAFELVGGTIPGASGQGECVIEIPVKAFEEGNHIDTIPQGAFKTTGGDNDEPTAATLKIDESQDATISKSFNPTTIPGDGRSTVTITINNPNDYDLVGTTAAPTLVDELPSTPNQLLVDTRPDASNPATNCTGGTVAIENGGTRVELVGGTIPAKGSCTVTFPVTQTNGGEYNNTIPAGTLSTVNQISNGNEASDKLNIQTEVTISKAFGQNNIDEGETTNITITIRNGGGALTNATLTDNLPAPLIVATPEDAETNCTVSGNLETLPVTSGASSFSLAASQGQIPSSNPNDNSLGECQIVVAVTLDPGTGDNIPGVNTTTLTNTIPASGLGNTEGRTNDDPASAEIKARPALVVGKSYSNDDTISPGDTTLMQISIQNRSNALDATGVGFVDDLPSPLQVATPLNVSDDGDCGSGAFSGLSAGDTILTYTGGTVAKSSTCVISIAVFLPENQGVDAGDFLDNIINNDSVTNNQGLDSNGVTGQEGRLEVVSRVEITKAFDANTIRRGNDSRLIITIENNRRSTTTGAPEPLTEVAITDNLPPNLRVADSPDFSHTGCDYQSGVNGSPSFTGITAGSITFRMTNGSLAPVDDSDPEVDTCTIQFNVTEIDRNFFSTGNATPRTYDNTTSGFSNKENETATDATAQLTVISPLSGEKSFQSAKITAGGRSTAVIRLTNSLPTDLTVVSFTDSWTQSNTIVADPANANTTCNGAVDGTVSTTSGSRSVTLNNGVVPAKVGDTLGACEIRFDVEMDATGNDTFTNTIPAEGISTSQGFTNPSDLQGVLTRTTATVNLNKAFSPNSLTVGDPGTLTITVVNPTNGIPITEFGFTDDMPSDMVVFSVPGATTDCTNGTINAVAGNTEFTLSGAELNSGESCTVSLQVTLVDTGNSINAIPISTIESKENVTNDQPAQATLNALEAIKPGKSFNPSSVAGGEISQLTLTIENLQQDTSSGESLANVSITDPLPTDLFIAGIPNASTTCSGGTVNAPAGGTVVEMTGATLAPGASCEVLVDVISVQQGSYENQIDAGNLTAQIQPSLGGSTIENTTKPKATLTVTSDSLPPEMVLVKRITAINGAPITGFENGSDAGDDDSHWPTPKEDSLRGVIDLASPVVPGDEIEYTIYYLNTGLSDATDLQICDRIPTNTTFVPRGYSSGTPPADPNGLSGADRGIVLAEAGNEVSLTNANDGDGGYYFIPNQDPGVTFPDISCDGNSSNGTIVVSISNAIPPAVGAGSPPASYGYIRFVSKVD